jgi:hypothetical protein
VKALAEKITPDPGNLAWGSRAVDNVADYRARLHSIIDKTREDLNVNIPWVIGLTASDTEVRRPTLPNRPGNTYADEIRSGQSSVISNPGNRSQLFLGPDMDASVTIRRSGDYVHFGQGGLAQAASAWYNRLESLLTANSISPIIPSMLGAIQQPLSINENGVTAKAPPGYDVS